MKKYILPAALIAMLTSETVHAQMAGYQDPFNTFFDTMVSYPQHHERYRLMEPRMDVADLKDKIEVKVELPGMDEKDINLSLENGILTLSGERTQEKEEQNKDYYIKETSSGSFSRSVRLPKNIDESKIDAVFKKGLLIINVPKTDVIENTVKKIPIKSED